MGTCPSKPVETAPTQKINTVPLNVEQKSEPIQSTQVGGKKKTRSSSKKRLRKHKTSKKGRV
jgi:hypothetical protein